MQCIIYLLTPEMVKLKYAFNADFNNVTILTSP